VPFRLPHMPVGKTARDNPRDPCTIFSITACPRTSQWQVKWLYKMWAHERRCAHE
jgi:hypothetical protein